MLRFSKHLQAYQVSNCISSLRSLPFASSFWRSCRIPIIFNTIPSSSHHLHCCGIPCLPSSKSPLHLTPWLMKQKGRHSLLSKMQNTGVSHTRMQGSGSEINVNSRSLSRRSIVVKVKDLEKYLRMRGYFTLKWAISLLGIAGFAIYMFREPIKENLSDEVADVASRSLGDENVVLRANEISKAIVNQVLTDPSTLKLALQFLMELLQDEKLLRNAIEFVKAVLNDSETQATISNVAERTLQRLLADEKTKKLTLAFVQSILADVTTKEACQDLLTQLTADKETKKLLADFFKNVLSSDVVTSEAVSLGKNVTKQVITDRGIQEETGVALWAAVKNSLTPTWFLTSEVKTMP